MRYPTPTLEKMIQITLLAVSCFRTALNRNQSQVFRRPSCRKTTKVSLQNVGWTRFRRSSKPRVLLTTVLLESQPSLQTG